MGELLEPDLFETESGPSPEPVYVKLPPEIEIADVPLLTVIVTGVVVDAAANAPLAVIDAVTEHVPDPAEIVTVLPLIVQAVDDPTEYVIVPSLAPADGVADTT